MGRRSSITFDNADITVAVKTPQGTQIAEAFNATDGVREPAQMRWVSLGLPRLLAPEQNQVPDSEKGKSMTVWPFEKTADGFFIYIETLNQEVAENLAKEASIRYGYSIKPFQFLALDKHIGKFDCEMKLYDSVRKSHYKLKGRQSLLLIQ